MAEKTFIARVLAAQNELKAPKNQYNSFGKYKYRSCEDILEAAKPVCLKYSIMLNLSDDVVCVGERYYIKATATLYDTESEATISSAAFAREALDKKGMDDSQITGTASSYARKYALNGLFNIDDTKDADTDENALESGKSKPKEYKCCDCGKAFEPFADHNGKSWNAGQVYHLAIDTAKKKGITDGKARCSECMNKLLAKESK